MIAKTNSSKFRLGLLAAGMIGVLGLSACTSVGYRCPLDPMEQPESPTACAGMHDALNGAKNNSGGRTSVFLDDQGRIVPKEVVTGTTAKPLAGALPTANNRYDAPSGQPVFQNPKVFQVWNSSFVDANGNLHDGHHSWFATPGQWSDNTVNKGSAVGAAILRPTSPHDRPAGNIVPVDRAGVPLTTTNGATFVPVAQQPVNPSPQNTTQTLEQLGQAALSGQRTAAAQSAPGITAPAVGLSSR